LPKIKLRACIKIGDLSRELETNERVRTDLRDTSDVQTKTETLEAAGINIRTAERYEELTGGWKNKLKRFVSTANAANSSAEQKRKRGGNRRV
jgi:hypothetical protein